MLSNISVESYVSFYTLEKVYIKGEAWKNAQYKTSPRTAAYVRIDYLQTDTPMLNKGTTAQPNRPYQRNSLLIPEAVQALDGYGEGINADCYTYICWDKKQFVKRVGKVDLGTLVWNITSGYESRFNAVIANSPVTNNIICSKYSSVGDKKIFVYDNRIYVDDSAYTDTTTFKSAMSGVMLYYELTTPEVTDISDLLSADNFLAVEGGGTITAVNENGLEAPSEITYMLKETTV